MGNLSVILGHKLVVVTGRHAHLRIDQFREADYAMLHVELNKQGTLAELPAAAPAEAAAGVIGCAVVARGSMKTSKKVVDATHPPLKNGTTRP